MDTEKVKAELLKDYKCELEKIDFCNYNPASREFMSPLSIGMMWLVLCKMDTDKIMEEIDGAREYAESYTESGNDIYRIMANDELKHANMLISIHKQKNHDKDYSKYEEMISSISKMIMP